MRRLITSVWRWFWRVPEDRKLVALLVWVNILGAIYGFEWYRIQLLSTNVVFWPVVPDSPLSTLLFGIMIAMLYYGKRSDLLMGISYVSMAKYGFWTVLIFGQAWATRGFAYWEELFLCSSHLAMAVEAILFYRVFAPARKYVLAAGIWVLFNDFMDYVYGFHPYLPFAEHLPSIRIYTPALTLLVTAGFVFARPFADRGAAWFSRIRAERALR